MFCKTNDLKQQEAFVTAWDKSHIQTFSSFSAGSRRTLRKLFPNGICVVVLDFR